MTGSNGWVGINQDVVVIAASPSGFLRELAHLDVVDEELHRRAATRVVGCVREDAEHVDGGAYGCVP